VDAGTRTFEAASGAAEVGAAGKAGTEGIAASGVFLGALTGGFKTSGGPAWESGIIVRKTSVALTGIRTVFRDAAIASATADHTTRVRPAVTARVLGDEEVVYVQSMMQSPF